jgi:hypothetical protein
MKRSHALIRNFIQEMLKNRPMTAYEIATSTDPNLNVKTVKRHLIYLQSLGIVGEGKFKVRKFMKDGTKFEDYDKKLWQIKIDRFKVKKIIPIR